VLIAQEDMISVRNSKNKTSKGNHMKIRMQRLRAGFMASLLSLSILTTVGFTGTVAAAGLNCTWTGATNNNFNTAGNWTSCSGGVPSAADNLVFDVSTPTADVDLVNDISGLSVANITFSGGTASGYMYSLTGNAITVTGGVDVATASARTSIETPIVLGGNVTLNVANGAFVSVTGAVSGTGNITKTGSGYAYFEGSSSFDGSITANGGTIAAGTAESFSLASLTINDGADLAVSSCTGGFTFVNAITLVGASSSPSGQNPSPKLSSGALCQGGGGSADETYARTPTADQEMTFAGAITLGSDVTFGGIAKTTTLTGALNGNYKFTTPSNWGGSLVVSSSSNNSGMANGTYTPDLVLVTLSDSQPANSVAIGSGAVVTIDGVRGTVNVGTGGTLKGTGTVGTLSVNAGGTLAPGHSPGCITSGNFILAGTYQAEIGGTTACTGYDQQIVNGTVDLTGGTLQTSLYNGFLPAQGQTYTIINNDGTDAVTGAFAGLAEGATFQVSDGVFRVSYVGGDGNDVVVTVVTAPTTPDTGFGLIAANPGVTLGVAAVAAGALVLIARKMRLSPVRVRSSSARRRR
jgi:fibronectin-binding autotransporter adhesin